MIAARAGRTVALGADTPEGGEGAGPRGRGRGAGGARGEGLLGEPRLGARPERVPLAGAEPGRVEAVAVVERHDRRQRRGRRRRRARFREPPNPRGRRLRRSAPEPAALQLALDQIELRVLAGTRRARCGARRVPSLGDAPAPVEAPPEEHEQRDEQPAEVVPETALDLAEAPAGEEELAPGPEVPDRLGGGGGGGAG